MAGCARPGFGWLHNSMTSLHSWCWRYCDIIEVIGCGREMFCRHRVILATAAVSPMRGRRPRQCLEVCCPAGVFSHPYAVVQLVQAMACMQPSWAWDSRRQHSARRQWAALLPRRQQQQRRRVEWRFSRQLLSSDHCCSLSAAHQLHPLARLVVCDLLVSYLAYYYYWYSVPEGA